jgi:hypothetical protein
MMNRQAMGFLSSKISNDQGFVFLQRKNEKELDSPSEVKT